MMWQYAIVFLAGFFVGGIVLLLVWACLAVMPRD